jgi:hypothetical protein
MQTPYSIASAFEHHEPAHATVRILQYIECVHCYGMILSPRGDSGDTVRRHEGAALYLRR